MARRVPDHRSWSLKTRQNLIAHDGACGTVYRKPGDYHIRVGLACQTVVEPDMYLTQIPFFPANRTRLMRWVG